MERKTAIILATAALFCVVAVAFAAQWYFSAPQTVSVTDYVVLMNPISETGSVTNGTTIYISGTAKLKSGEFLPSGTIVYLFVNGTQTEYYGFTDESGYWSLNYDVLAAAGTTLEFKAGIYQ